jgi:hypothetical protein
MEDNLITDEKKEGNKILALAVIVIIVVIIGIRTYLNNQNDKIGLDTASCISKNSLLFVANGCSHCIIQENILGKYYNLFNVTDCIENPLFCFHYGVTATPTWIINEKKVEGSQSISKLKELTGC